MLLWAPEAAGCGGALGNTKLGEMHPMHNAMYTRAGGRRGRWAAAVAGGLALTLIFIPDALAAKAVGTNGNDAAAAIPGTAGPDLLFGLGGNDVFSGDSGNDILLPGPGTDNVNGEGDGDIVLDDDADADQLKGGGAGDFFAAANGVVDTINCGGGTDFVAADANDVIDSSCEPANVYTSNATGVTIPLPFCPSNTYNLIFGTASGENLVGTGAQDVIFGKGGNDAIASGGGCDIVFGGPGKDSINSGADGDIVVDDDASSDSIATVGGNDTVLVLNGNVGGADEVNCGAGTDRIHFDVVDAAKSVTTADVVAACEDQNPPYPPGGGGGS